MKRLILVVALAMFAITASASASIPRPVIVIDNPPTCDPVFTGSPCFGPPNTGYHPGDAAEQLITVEQDDPQSPGSITTSWPAGELTFVTNDDTANSTCVVTTSSVTCTYTDFGHGFKSDTFHYTVGNNPPSTVIPVTVTATTVDGTSDPVTTTLTMAGVLTGGGLTLKNGIEQVLPAGASFDFTSSSATAVPSDFTSTIDWGDGSAPDTGVVSGANGSFTVSGSHVYAEEGTYTVKVTVTGPDGTVTASGKVTVTDAALTASCSAPSTSLQSFSGGVATFNDPNSSAPLSDFSATIDWGDGSTSTGTVSGSGGHYSVAGSHTYTGTGPVTVKTSITDVGGSTASTSCGVLVYAFAPGGGAFAIGDRNSILTHPVTFWSNTWKAQNRLSGGSPVPNAFKGFAMSPAVPSCGLQWTTKVGKKAPPPPAGPLPAYMGVWVTSSVTKSGKIATGYTFGIDIVKTDPGYANDLMHQGTGTVVAHVCSSQF